MFQMQARVFSTMLKHQLKISGGFPVTTCNPGEPVLFILTPGAWALLPSHSAFSCLPGDFGFQGERGGLTLQEERFLNPSFQRMLHIGRPAEQGSCDSCGSSELEALK